MAAGNIQPYQRVAFSWGVVHHPHLSTCEINNGDDYVLMVIP